MNSFEIVKIILINPIISSFIFRLLLSKDVVCVCVYNYISKTKRDNLVTGKHEAGECAKKVILLTISTTSLLTETKMEEKEENSETVYRNSGIPES